MSNENQLVSSQYTLFGSSKYWILTNHGISTDFLVKIGHNFNITTKYIDIIFNFHNMNITGHYNSNNSREKKVINEFKSDWKDLLLGKSIKKDVIFLTKNPINRFIEAIVDEKLQIFDNEQILHNIFLKKSLYKNFGNEISDEFIKWADNKHNKQFRELFQEENLIPLKFKNIIEQILFDLILPILKNDNFQECHRLYHDISHTYQNLYFLHNMLFNPPINFLKEKVSIIDIDRENLLKFLNIKYGMDLHFEKDNPNITVPYLVVLDKLSNSNLYKDIEEALKPQVKLWKSITKKQYPSEIYNTTSMKPWVNKIEDNDVLAKNQKHINNYYTQNND
jgi:hypothetical protein